MIDDGILFSYANAGEYAASVQRIRDRICVGGGGYLTLRDRKTRNKRRFAIAIFDETGAAEIDVCLLGNTTYILAMRMAEHKWFPTADQQEFFGCDSSIFSTLPFRSGYGALGIVGNVDLPRFTIDQASQHCRAMKEYMLAWAGGQITAEQTERCKLAFAFFAMTIAEAARFHSIEAMMYGGGIDPAGVIPTVQSWVISSCVPDNVFPTHSIAIAGIPEKPRGSIMEAVTLNAWNDKNKAPYIEDICLKSKGTAAFMGREGVFTQLTLEEWLIGYGFLLYAYYLNRCEGNALEKAHKNFDRFREKKQAVTQKQLNNMAL